MPKRPETVETVLLALELLRRIPRGRKVEAKYLHQQLKDAGIERDLRTIQRQLDMLSQHFSIERDDRNKPYGYCWKESSDALAVPSLTPQQSLLLNLAEAQLKHLLPSRVTRSMDGFFAQARRNLAHDHSAKLEKQWPSKVRVVATTQPLLPPNLQDGVFEVVSEALYLNQWLEVNYKNANAKRTSSKVMPLGLAQQGSRLYLVCRFDGYDNERCLALNRILSATLSTLSFKRPDDFDLKRFDDDGRFGYGDGKWIKLSFTIDRDAGLHLMESPLSKDQTVAELKDNRLRITATVVESDILTRWLRSFGEAVSGVKMERTLT